MGLCTAQCKLLLFCAKTIVRGSCNSELAHLKKKEEEEEEEEDEEEEEEERMGRRMGRGRGRGRRRGRGGGRGRSSVCELSGLVLLQSFFATLVDLIGQENTQR